MASLQNRNGSFWVFFESQRKQRVFTIGRVTEVEAKSKADQVDYLLKRLAQGLIELPPDTGIVEVVRQDGKVILTKDGTVTPTAKLILGSLRERYLETTETARLRSGPSMVSGCTSSTCSPRVGAP